MWQTLSCSKNPEIINPFLFEWRSTHTDTNGWRCSIPGVQSRFVVVFAADNNSFVMANGRIGNWQMTG